MTLAEDIIQGANIVDVIGRYVSLSKSGANYKGLCPFHGEKSPSFVVSPQKQIFKCFGCGVGGDVITFIKEIEHVDFIEAAKILAKDAGVAIEDYQSSNYNATHQSDKEKLYDLNRLAQNYFAQSLKKSPDAQSYLHEARSLSDEVITYFGIGYAPDSYYDMTEYLRAKGYDTQQQINGSLAKKSQNGDPYAFYRDRVIFPIYDTRSRVIGFGGRALGPDTKPKYINTTDTIIYDKSSVLYGLNRAKTAVRDQGSIIVVEGYMDVIALHRLGYRAAVATCGTSLTASHISLLKKYTDRLIFLFDQDKAGLEATKRALGIAYTYDVYPLVMTIDQQYKDIDELANAVDQGSLDATDLDQHTQDGLSYIIDHLQSQLDPTSPIDKKRLLIELFSMVAMVSSLSIQQHYLSTIADALRMDDSIIIAEFQSYISQNKRIISRQLQHAEITKTDATPQFHPSQEELLAALFAQQWIVEYLPTIEKLPSLLEWGEVVAQHREGIVSRAVSGTLSDQEKAIIDPIHLWREEQLASYTTEDEKYTIIIQRTGAIMQRLTQSVIKSLPPQEKAALIALLHKLR